MYILVALKGLRVRRFGTERLAGAKAGKGAQSQSICNLTKLEPWVFMVQGGRHNVGVKMQGPRSMKSSRDCGPSKAIATVSVWSRMTNAERSPEMAPYLMLK